MKRALVALGFALALVGLPRPVHAQSEGASVLAIELCPQSICGAAIFYGAIHIDDGSGTGLGGTITGALQHDELPAGGELGTLTDGLVLIQLGADVTALGLVGGFLFNNDDGTYTVLALFSDGVTFFVFEGVLDHNFFPPLVYGVMYPLVL